MAPLQLLEMMMMTMMMTMLMLMLMGANSAAASTPRARRRLDDGDNDAAVGRLQRGRLPARFQRKQRRHSMIEFIKPNFPRSPFLNGSMGQLELTAGLLELSPRLLAR